MSSKRSLIAEILITIRRGNKMAGYPPEIEMAGITYRTIIKRK